jgi:alkylhydroperoxidase family enzyme
MLRYVRLASISLAAFVLAASGIVLVRAADPAQPAVELLDSETGWKRMPPTAMGGGGPLPSWARAVAVHLPRTAAAMLELDHAQRVRSPLPPGLRSAMRWVIAHANHCAYGEAYALADARRAGLSESTLQELQGKPDAWPAEWRDALIFARLLTVDAPNIPDALFARLVEQYGKHAAASMVLLAAYGNFQDRIVLGLNLPMESEGPLEPIAVAFAPGAFQSTPVLPPQNALPTFREDGETVVDTAPGWSDVSFEELQSRLEKQRGRQPRLPVPSWEEVKTKLPPEFAARPTRIVWNLVCMGYVPELAVPWSRSTRTMWAEARNDRVFEESLFWVQTRAIGCNYCMGHCEMLLEVAGMGRDAIAERTRRLAGDDWSAFPPEEQRAYAFARKLTVAPATLTPADYKALEADLGPERAMATFWWLCRGLYMTRISDGFQLPLERDNVFADFYGKPAATTPKAP